MGREWSRGPKSKHTRALPRRAAHVRAAFIDQRSPKLCVLAVNRRPQPQPTLALPLSHSVRSIARLKSLRGSRDAPRSNARTRR